MSGPLGFPPFERDLVDQLSGMLADYDGDAEKTLAVVSLSQKLIAEINRGDEPSKELVARLEVILIPQLGRIYEEASIDANMDQLFDAVRAQERLIDPASFYKETIKVRVERVVNKPSIIDDGLFFLAANLYIDGHLKEKKDLFVIQYLIEQASQHYSERSLLFYPPDKFIKNLSCETAYEALAFIIKKFPTFFMLNTRLIFENLITRQSDSSQSILTQKQFVELFLSQPNGWNSVSHLISISLELSKKAINILFEAFSSDERTLASFTEAVISKLHLLINPSMMDREPITPSAMHFLILAFGLISDKVEVFENLETLQALSYEVTYMSEFVQFKERVAHEKALQLSSDPM